MAFLLNQPGRIFGSKMITGIFKFQRSLFSSSFIVSETIPDVLTKTEEAVMIRRPWATYPFPKESELKMPVYEFKTGNYSGEYVKLDPNYFNQPLRRDIIHNAFIYHRKFGLRTFKRTKTKGTTAGSGKKPFPQKGRGQARVGNKRSPLLYGGGKAHGKVPRDFTIQLNRKYLLLGLKTMLSSWLFENKLIFIQDEKLDYPKTKILNGILENFNSNKILFVTPMDPWENFKLAAQNIPYVTVVNAAEFNVKDAVISDFVIFTKRGLEHLETIIKGKETEYYKFGNMPKKALPHHELLGIRVGKKPDFFDKSREDVEKFNIDITKDVQIHTKSLKGYLEKAIDYENERKKIQDSPDILWVNKKES